jgi:SAM-dependent methyltransferase
VREALRRSVFFPYEVLSAISMPLGAGVFADCAVEAAGIGASDRVADLGCGPGTASRAAARRGASVFGVDPSPMMLRFARWFTRRPLRARITWREGLAEAIPLDDGGATVALAIRAAHHFDDPNLAFGEIRRVLAPGGRLVIVESEIRPKSRGRRGHGFTPEFAAEAAAELEAMGFDQVQVGTRRAGRRGRVVLSAVRP